MAFKLYELKQRMEKHRKEKIYSGFACKISSFFVVGEKRLRVTWGYKMTLLFFPGWVSKFSRWNRDVVENWKSDCHELVREIWWVKNWGGEEVGRRKIVTMYVKQDSGKNGYIFNTMETHPGMSSCVQINKHL